MSDAAAPKTKKVVKKDKPAPTHPAFSEMINAAIASLKERTGSSRHAIVKYIVANYKVDEKKVNSKVKTALKKGVSTGSLKQVKGNGANGSFKVNKEEKAKKSPKKPAAKTTPKKAAKPKKSTPKKDKKTPEKKAKKTTPKKVKKTPEKKTKKSPEKKAKKAKSPAAKKPAVKKTKPAAKKVAKK